jgi:hypothetical protein
MSAPNPSKTSSSSSILGLLAGGVLGFIIAVFLVGIAGYAFIKKKEQDVRRGWNLVPVVVASQMGASRG